MPWPSRAAEPREETPSAVRRRLAVPLLSAPVRQRGLANWRTRGEPSHLRDHLMGADRTARALGLRKQPIGRLKQVATPNPSYLRNTMHLNDPTA
jgi:hypothetical protein